MSATVLARLLKAVQDAPRGEGYPTCEALQRQWHEPINPTMCAGQPAAPVAIDGGGDVDLCLFHATLLANGGNVQARIGGSEAVTVCRKAPQSEA